VAELRRADPAAALEDETLLLPASRRTPLRTAESLSRARAATAGTLTRTGGGSEDLLRVVTKNQVLSSANSGVHRVSGSVAGPKLRLAK